MTVFNLSTTVSSWELVCLHNVAGSVFFIYNISLTGGYNSSSWAWCFESFYEINFWLSSEIEILWNWKNFGGLRLLLECLLIADWSSKHRGFILLVSLTRLPCHWPTCNKTQDVRYNFRDSEESGGFMFSNFLLTGHFAIPSVILDALWNFLTEMDRSEVIHSLFIRQWVPWHGNSRTHWIAFMTVPVYIGGQLLTERLPAGFTEHHSLSQYNARTWIYLLSSPYGRNSLEPLLSLAVEKTVGCVSEATVKGRMRNSWVAIYRSFKCGNDAATRINFPLILGPLFSMLCFCPPPDLFSVSPSSLKNHYKIVSNCKRCVTHHRPTGIITSYNIHFLHWSCLSPLREKQSTVWSRVLQYRRLDLPQLTDMTPFPPALFLSSSSCLPVWIFIAHHYLFPTSGPCYSVCLINRGVRSWSFGSDLPMSTRGWNVHPKGPYPPEAWTPIRGKNVHLKEERSSSIWRIIHPFTLEKGLPLGSCTPKEERSPLKKTFTWGRNDLKGTVTLRRKRLPLGRTVFFYSSFWCEVALHERVTLYINISHRMTG